MRFRLAATFAVAFSTVAAADSASAQPSQAAPAVDRPAVTDPMLAAPPPARIQLRSWDEALALLRSHSPEYQSGIEGVRRAEAAARVALAAVLPHLSAQGSYTHQFLTETIRVGSNSTATPSPNTWAASAVLDWSVLNPRAIYAVGTAKRNVQATELTFEDKRRTIALLVVQAMLSTLAAARVADLDRVGLRSALERLALTETRLQFGQGTPLDVDRAKQDVAAARAQLITGDESLLETREALGEALGTTTPLAAPGDLDLDAFEAAVARTCRVGVSIDRRPDVAAARMRVEVAERSVHDAELLFSPSVSVSSQLSTATVSVFAPRTQWDIQGVLTVPLYDGGARYGLLKDSRAALEQARQDLVVTRISAFVASTRSERSVSVNEASRDVAREQRDLAARIDQRTRDDYARGSGTSLDLVVSAQSLRQAETDLVLLEVRVAEARSEAALTSAECVY